MTPAAARRAKPARDQDDEDTGSTDGGTFILRGRPRDPRYVRGWAEGIPSIVLTGDPARALGFATRAAAEAWVRAPNQELALKALQPIKIVPRKGARRLVPAWRKEATKRGCT